MSIETPVKILIVWSYIMSLMKMEHSCGTGHKQLSESVLDWVAVKNRKVWNVLWEVNGKNHPFPKLGTLCADESTVEWEPWIKKFPFLKESYFKTKANRTAAVEKREYFIVDMLDCS